MTHPVFHPGDVAKARDGETYSILSAKINHDLPQMSRYSVLRADNTQIDNFPGYLLVSSDNGR